MCIPACQHIQNKTFFGLEFVSHLHEYLTEEHLNRKKIQYGFNLLKVIFSFPEKEYSKC